MYRHMPLSLLLQLQSQKNNRRKFWEILKRIIGKFSSIIGAGLLSACILIPALVGYTVQLRKVGIKMHALR